MSAPIFISGVGKRLGLAMARECLARGLPVIGTYRSEYPALNELRDGGADLIACDFYSDVQVASLISEVKTRYSCLRAVVHNASDWLPDEHSEFSSMDIINKMMRVHVSVPYHLNLSFQDLLKANPQGMADIVHITDYVAASGSKKHIAYAASKAALDNMSLSFASLCAPVIKVNSIAPALILFNPDDDEVYKKKALDKSLLCKEGGEQEVVNALFYIFQSQYMTGRTLHLDGGRHLR
jgi:dihydromonapterin reductase / dihydrofolate reductase